MTAALQKVVEQVKRLNEDERRQLTDLLRNLRESPVSITDETEFARRLAAEGRLTLPTGSPRPVVPVPANGKPVSEMIIEERR